MTLYVHIIFACNLILHTLIAYKVYLGTCSFAVKLKYVQIRHLLAFVFAHHLLHQVCVWISLFFFRLCRYLILKKGNRKTLFWWQTWGSYISVSSGSVISNLNTFLSLPLVFSEYNHIGHKKGENPRRLWWYHPALNLTVHQYNGTRSSQQVAAGLLIKST